MPVSENTSVSVLDNATTARYIHTLNVSGTKLPAVYGCSVFNNKPSSAKVIVTIDDSGTIYDYIKYIMVASTELVAYVLSFHNTGTSNTKKISMSSSKSNLVAGESVNLTCTATFGSEDGVQYMWSGPAVNDSGSNRILSLHNIHLSEAGECSASLDNSSITAGIPVILQCKWELLYYHQTKKHS